MPTRFSNTRRHRGNVSAGHGRVGKHRKSPGGRGLAGGQHHHRINMDKYHPGYFGKVGMRHFHDSKKTLGTINLDRLYSLFTPEVREQLVAGKFGDKAPVLDLTSLGYNKLLGKGRLPEAAIIVQARFVSRRAEEKIKAAGGVVVIKA
ncbi:putative 60S ribosomal protein L28 [Protomyces lactucae-debilis]|uniref:Putative 60S ribosomal protein L28 n=1 Tax=Protomyces lactucae-debilis TaxID=2754530 RepID=A0A1Y2EW02_PROLT|nr:putative 60S ribosomal protein L28 [Protomyces lactucae-debilis]ORY75782.1 putative 60S ribosomal protein L28 [Protomyces lactucae-debilis]